MELHAVRIMRCTIRALMVYNNETSSSRISLKIRRFAFAGHAHRCSDRSLFIRLFVYSRVKGWLNRTTREHLHSGHCFRAGGEKNSAVRWSRDLQPVAIQLELFRESRVSFGIFKAATADRVWQLTSKQNLYSFICQRWTVREARHASVALIDRQKDERSRSFEQKS